MCVIGSNASSCRALSTDSYLSGPLRLCERYGSRSFSPSSLSVTHNSSKKYLREHSFSPPRAVKLYRRPSGGSRRKYKPRRATLTFLPLPEAAAVTRRVLSLSRPPDNSPGILEFPVDCRPGEGGELLLSGGHNAFSPPHEEKNSRSRGRRVSRLRVRHRDLSGQKELFSFFSSSFPSRGAPFCAFISLLVQPTCPRIRIVARMAGNAISRRFAQNFDL